MTTITNKTTTEVGLFFKKDHSTVIHGRDRIALLRKKNMMINLKLKWYEAEIARQVALDNPVDNGGCSTPALTEISEAP